MDHILRAKENLILRRETHLDQLADKLKEDRVRRVIEPLLAGSENIADVPDDDVEYVSDLGLIRKSPQLAIANGIYKEVIPRKLTYVTQMKITHQTEWYVGEDGRLDMDKLFTGFQEFFREHFERWVEGFDYAEAGAQLLVQAFLQRILNGGGTVHREYGLGRKRTDLLVTWNHPGGTQKVIVELKILHRNLETTIQKGLEQTCAYMDTSGTTEGYLLVFDRRPDIPWETKIFKEKRQYGDTPITVFGM